MAMGVMMTATALLVTVSVSTRAVSETAVEPRA
jgi:hypothetical protein